MTLPPIPQTQVGHLVQQTARPIKGEKRLVSLNVETGAVVSKPNGATVERRANAWLNARIRAGKTDRFCEIKAVGPVLAEEMLAHNTRNRPLVSSAVERFAKAMAEGRWRLTSEAIAFDTDGVLIDGQHRLHAVLESGVQVQMAVWFGCNPSEFDALDQGMARTGGHLLALAGFPDANNRAALVSLITRVRTGRQDGISAQELLNIASDMKQEPLTAAIRYGGVAYKTTKSKTAGALAAWWIMAHRKTQSDFEDFWEALRVGANLQKGSPILRLRQMFADGAFKETNSRNRAVRIAAAIILTWNAWDSNTRLKSLDWNHVTKLPPVV
jgi:hypothetical protein